MDTPIITLDKLNIMSNEINGSSVKIIHDVDLRIYEKEIFGIIGPSGAGKTTLLRTLALLINPKQISGNYFYKSKQVLPLSSDNEFQQVRKELIFIHQFPVLFKGTVKYNIRYGLKIRKQDTDVEFLEQLISSFKLTDLLDRDVFSLSGGEKQRVCLLRAMAIKPRVLILDEPTQNLDPANIKNIEKNIKRFRDIEGGTVIVVTHNLFQTRRLTDRSAILINGKIIEVGETNNIFKSPKNQQTTDFLSGKIVF
jgi:tungstate transport system ATP-binding protein